MVEAGDVVFGLFHEHTLDDESGDDKLIGIFASEATAEEARRKLLGEPGFKESPEDFTIYPFVIDELNWTEGFVTIR